MSRAVTQNYLQARLPLRTQTPQGLQACPRLLGSGLGAGTDRGNRRGTAESAKLGRYLYHRTARGRLPHRPDYELGL